MNRRTALTSLAASTAMAAQSTPVAKASSPSFIETDDGARLYIRDWGSGAPILFVHSWAVNLDLWQYQMVPLSAHRMRCIAFDRRGHGRSTEPGHGYTVDRLADDLAAVIDQLDLKNLTLVGHSLGCCEIVRYLSRYGAERVARIALTAPTMPYYLKSADHPDGLITEERSKLVRDRMAADFPGWIAENARPFFVPETSQALVDWGAWMMAQTPLKVALDCNRIVVETDYRAELARIRVPALVIHGDKDVSAPLDLTGRRTAQLIPGSRLVVYEGAPHGLMFTHRERLNADLLAFVKS